jgi:N-acetylglucosaminyldiphosphoundecaprenol N-acetyl-beta-D-mannosaminyltransferase
MNRPSKVNVLGVGVSPFDLLSATEHLLGAVNDRRQGYVCVTGVHGVTEAQDNPEFRQILNRAFVNTPDGMPMTWMGRLQGNRAIDRVYGPDLMLQICRASPARGIRHFFYGGKEGVAELLASRLREKIPNLEVVGTYCPPFRPLTEEEEYALVEQMNSCEPHCIWVGLSTPKQEKFMAGFLGKFGEHRAEPSQPALLSGKAALFFGVGAAFDFHAGLIPQAPFWMQRSGLEWAYRLVKEPRRLAGRYLRNNPLFLGRALFQLTGVRRYAVEDSKES